MTFLEMCKRRTTAKLNISQSNIIKPVVGTVNLSTADSTRKDIYKQYFIKKSDYNGSTVQKKSIEIKNMQVVGYSSSWRGDMINVLTTRPGEHENKRPNKLRRSLLYSLKRSTY